MDEKRTGELSSVGLPSIEAVRAAARKCPAASEVLRELFPTAFKVTLRDVKVGQRFRYVVGNGTIWQVVRPVGQILSVHPRAFTNMILVVSLKSGRLFGVTAGNSAEVEIVP